MNTLLQKIFLPILSTQTSTCIFYDIFFSTNQDCLASSIIEVSLVVIDLWKIYIYKYITSMLMSSSLIRHRMTMIF